MGAKPSLQEELINLRLTSKQMQRSAGKCEANQNSNKAKLKKSIEKGDPESARIYAQNVIREKNQALNCLRLSSRIDAVASRLETAIRMQTVSKSMEGVVRGMGTALQSMDVERISSTMDNFEKQFEDMDVRSAYMEDAMNASTSTATPQDQVDSLIQMVADEAGLQVGNMLDDVGTAGRSVPQSEQATKSPSNELEARYDALRK